MTGSIQKTEEILHFLYFYAFVTQEIPIVLKLKIKKPQSPPDHGRFVCLTAQLASLENKQNPAPSSVLLKSLSSSAIRKAREGGRKNELAFLTTPGADAWQMDPSGSKLTQLPAWLSTSSSKLPCICLCF